MDDLTIWRRLTLEQWVSFRKVTTFNWRQWKRIVCETKNEDTALYSIYHGYPSWLTATHTRTNRLIAWLICLRALLGLHVTRTHSRNHLLERDLNTFNDNSQCSRFQCPGQTFPLAYHRFHYYATFLFKTPLSTLQYASGKCVMESVWCYRNWIELEGIKIAPTYPVNLRWRVIYWLVRGFRVVDVARILHVW